MVFDVSLLRSNTSQIYRDLDLYNVIKYTRFTSGNVSVSKLTCDIIMNSVTTKQKQ